MFGMKKLSKAKLTQLEDVELLCEHLGAVRTRESLDVLDKLGLVPNPERVVLVAVNYEILCEAEVLRRMRGVEDK